MTNWWKGHSGESIVQGFVQSLYKPQYPSAGVYMHLPDRESLARVSSIVQSAEVASKELLSDLRFHADPNRPYQWHHLRITKEQFASDPEIYASVIEKLVALGVVRDIKANYGF